jgi:hypothetical protein
MTGRLPAECLALATGLFPTRPPSQAELVRASKLRNKAQAHVRAFLKAETPAKWESWQRPPAQEELHKDLLAPLDPNLAVTDEVAPLILLPQWLLVLDQAKKYAVDKWPIFDAEGLTPANFTLAPDEYGDEWDIVRALDGIENFFGDLRAHCLASEQVAAVKACYPDWWEALDALVFDELADLLAKKKQLTWQQEDMVRVLRDMPGELPITATQPAAPPKRAPKPQPNKAIQEARTPTERIDANAAR